MTAPRDPVLRTGIFNDPLADWPNDDLLIKQQSRDKLRATHAHLLRVLDWPELRHAFVSHDRPAGRGKRASHREGLVAVTFAGLGVVLLGVTPTLPAATAAIVATIALLIMTVGGGLGVMHWLVLHSKSAWLGHRFWTERLRQLYFQSLVNTLELAAKAMTDDTSLDELRRKRAIWLAELYVNPADPRDRLHDIVADRTEAQTWLRHEWRECRAQDGRSKAVLPLMEALYRQRIGVQSVYAKMNLGSDVFSPSTRAKTLHGIGDGSTVLVVVAAALGWVAHLLGPTVMGLSALAWTSVVAVLSAIGLMARATDQGLQNEADADRYEWYADAVNEVKARYEAGDATHRILELRRLEELSYQELRRFLRAHNTARFMM